MKPNREEKLEAPGFSRGEDVAVKANAQTLLFHVKTLQPSKGIKLTPAVLAEDRNGSMSVCCPTTGCGRSRFGQIVVSGRTVFSAKASSTVWAFEW
jgi:hypothetical protein